MVECVSNYVVIFFIWFKTNVEITFKHEIYLYKPYSFSKIIFAVAYSHPLTVKTGEIISHTQKKLFFKPFQKEISGGGIKGDSLPWSLPIKSLRGKSFV